MNRKKIKEEAKLKIKDHLWDILLPYIVVSLISAAVGSLIGIDSENIWLGASSSLFLEFVISPLTFGCTAYVLNFTRGKEYDLKQVFSYYKYCMPIFALTFLTSLFSTLWSLLLIIPGIIASISYSMSIYIMIDGEEDAMQCIKRSKKMMKGYKWDYIKFVLSFFGWYLLEFVTLGLISIYLIPYQTVSEILYYEELKKYENNTLV